MILPRESAKTLAMLMLLCCTAFPSLAEPINIPNIKADITFDGELNEPVWQQAKHVSVNIVNYPYENTPSPVQTDAYIFEDGTHIYFAFIAQDPNPEKIQAFIRDRDDAFSDDIVGIKLDTFNNHRLAYKFFVNPYGVQNDGIDNEMTSQNSNLWDGIWDANGKVTENGYQVEFAIPYRELNFEEGDDIKTWGIELIRIYPRDKVLRISNIELDRDDPCWTCQMAEMQGFEQAKIGENLLVTPSVVAKVDEERDVYQNEDWQSDNDAELGLNVRWGITPDVMLNATINPDFSNVEADAGKLSVNKTSALFFDEKRTFFLDNSEYFSSPLNLVYTRNITDPEVGAKITGKLGKQTFGFFMTKDNYTSLILPGNIYSLPDEISDESYSGALRYRYDINEDLSFGLTSTLRSADDYHNYVNAIDVKYKMSVSNTLIAQVLTSDTEYPAELYEKWCVDSGTQDECYLPSMINKNQGDFTDQAFNLEFEHNSEDWLFNTKYMAIGEDFRADLGYLPQVDYNEFTTTVNRTVYFDNTLWSEMIFGTVFQTSHNDDGDLINKRTSISYTLWGPWQSLFDVIYSHEEQVGLRFDTNNSAIDDNTSLFELDYVDLYMTIQPRADLMFGFSSRIGDSIDYTNNRKGELIEFAPELIWNISTHLELELMHVYAELEADNKYVYRENITDFRLTYAFNVNSFLRLTMVYNATDYNPNNNPDIIIDSNYHDNLSTQLLYSYKLNPQTVFFLGYSDNSIDNEQVGQKKEIKQNQRTAFLKLSYAWM